MNTLTSIIEQIDTELEQARELAPTPAHSPFLSGVQEKLRRYIQVTAGGLSLAIPVDDLFEVGHLPEITQLPNLPVWILGIMNLREEIISVIELNSLLFSLAGKISSDSRVVVLHNANMKVGIVIDRIVATVSFADSDRQTAPDTPLQQAAPDVFHDCIESDGQKYHILEAEALFRFDKLINYYDA